MNLIRHKSPALVRGERAESTLSPPRLQRGDHGWPKPKHRTGLGCKHACGSGPVTRCIAPLSGLVSTLALVRCLVVGILGGVLASSAFSAQVAYSSFLGGSDSEFARAVALDAAGNIYLAGYGDSSDFPLQNALDSTTSGHEVFVLKLTPDGSQILYATYLGGFNQDVALALAVDSAGNAYIAGSTYSNPDPNNPQNDSFPLVGAFQSTFDFSQGCCNPRAFLTKLSPNGDQILYSTFFGGTTRIGSVRHHGGRPWPCLDRRLDGFRQPADAGRISVGVWRWNVRWIFGAL